MKKEYFGIHKNVVLLGFVSFLNDISSELIWPILPLFLTSLGATGLIIGIIGGLKDSIAAVLQFFIGYKSDKIGKRKMFIKYGYIISGTFKTILAFATSGLFVLVAISLERVGKAMRTPSKEALISISMPLQKGKGFGFETAMDSLGAIVGSALVFILFWYLGFGFMPIILLAGAICFLTLIPLHFVKEIPVIPVKENFKFRFVSLPKDLRIFIFISSVFAVANFSYMFFILKASLFFSDPSAAIGMPILLYIIFNIFYSAFSVPFGELADQFGRKRVLIFGYALFAVTMLGFIYANSLAIFALLFAIYGIVFAIIQTNQKALVSDLSSEKHRATALGTFNTTTGIIALPASILAGGIWELFSPEATFHFGASLAFVALILFILFRKNFK